MMARRVVVIPGPAYRPPAYRPPSLRLGGRELSQAELKLRWENLGPTILFGSLGVGAIYGSGLLPDPVKTIVLVGGVGLIGYAAYSFIGSVPKSETEVPTGTGSQISTAGEFAAITGQFLQPKNGSSQGFNWFSDSYDVKVLVSNPNAKPVTVTFELIATEYPKLFMFIPTGSYDNYLADSKTVVLPANGNMTIDFLPKVKVSRWLSARMNVDLTLQKIRVGGEASPMDHVSFTLIG